VKIGSMGSFARAGITFGLSAEGDPSRNVDRPGSGHEPCRLRAGEAACTLFSFERPAAADVAAFSLSPDLENCTVAKTNEHLSPSRYEGHMVDALAPGADEGRGRLR
jgi:hypothetical protein